MVAAPVAIAVGVVLAACSRPGPGNGDLSIPSDVRALATEIEPGSPAGTITADEAIAAGEGAMGSPEGAEITTYLVRMTSTEIPAITDRDVWVVKYDGVQLPFSIPSTPRRAGQSWPDGTPTAGDVLYTFVDAHSGEWLAATTP